MVGSPQRFVDWIPHISPHIHPPMTLFSIFPNLTNQDIRPPSSTLTNQITIKNKSRDICLWFRLLQIPIADNLKKIAGMDKIFTKAGHGDEFNIYLSLFALVVYPSDKS